MTKSDKIWQDLTRSGKIWQDLTRSIPSKEISSAASSFAEVDLVKPAEETTNNKQQTTNYKQ